MDSLGKLQHCHQSLHLLVNGVPWISKPISYLSIRTPLPVPSSSSLYKSSSVRALKRSPSLSFDSFCQAPRRRGPSLPQILDPISSSILKTTCVTFAAAAATLFFMRFCGKPAIAAPIPPPTVESVKESTDGEEDKERALEEQLVHNPNDVEALGSLMEVRVKARKFPEAIKILDRLIELEPDDLEWLVLKANVYIHIGDSELARKEFERILLKDPFQAEAYHGLVMLTETSDTDSLKAILNRVEGALEHCKKLKGKSEERDFKLLIAQIKVMEGSYSEALKDYQELEREEPRDFRPYLCQGILYTLLKKNDEAEKQFEIFRRLVPKNHPYKEYFDENMFSTKHFVQQIERDASTSNH
ncbi:protein SLOW GREEN 1, chloroplastic, partial [Cucurbita argyrosperma subsp. argyrosperma]